MVTPSDKPKKRQKKKRRFADVPGWLPPHEYHINRWLRHTFSRNVRELPGEDLNSPWYDVMVECAYKHAGIQDPDDQEVLRSTVIKFVASQLSVINSETKAYVKQAVRGEDGK